MKLSLGMIVFENNDSNLLNTSTIHRFTGILRIARFEKVIFSFFNQGWRSLWELYSMEEILNRPP